MAYKWDGEKMIETKAKKKPGGNAALDAKVATLEKELDDAKATIADLEAENENLRAGGRR